MIERGVTDASASTIWRWLHEDAIKPWQTRSWIFARDPAFAEKAGRVLDLYDRTFEGKRLRPDEYVICADEKSQLQALGRRHPTVPAGPGRPGLVEFEYRRGGTLAYLAAWDVHHANLFDRVEPKTGIIPFGRLVNEVMSTEPYRSARRVLAAAARTLRLSEARRPMPTVNRSSPDRTYATARGRPRPELVSITTDCDGSGLSCEVHAGRVGVRASVAFLSKIVIVSPLLGGLGLTA